MNDNRYCVLAGFIGQPASSARGRVAPARNHRALTVGLGPLALVTVVLAAQVALPTPSAASSVPTGSYSVSGTLTNGAGVAIPNMPVGLYAADAVLGAGSQFTLPLVAQTTTNASGAWTITIPSPLPSSLQAMADANGGVLNVQAISSGVAPDGTAMSAVQSFGLTSTTSKDPSGLQQLVAQQDAQPIQTMFFPTRPDAQTTYDDGGTIDASGNTLYLSDSGTDYTSGDQGSGKSSSVAEMETLNGIDYSSVVPTAVQDKCNSPVAKVVKRASHVETPISEAHGYWDATGAVRLGSTESQTFGLGYSADNKLWSLHGSTSMGQNWGTVMSIDEPGPMHSNQVDVPIDWAKFHLYTPRCDGTILEDGWYWRAVKYDPAAGQDAISLGRSVFSDDGYNNYVKSNPDYRMSWPANTGFGIIKGTSLTYSFTAGIFPLSITAETAYDATREQHIKFGSQTYPSHDIWSNNHRPDQGAKVFYSW